MLYGNFIDVILSYVGCFIPISTISFIYFLLEMLVSCKNASSTIRNEFHPNWNATFLL